MVQVNPKLLVEQKPVKVPFVRQRPTMQNLSPLQLVKVALSSVFEGKILNVKLNNEEQVVNRIVSKLDVLNSTIKNMPRIDMGDTPASIQIQTMSEKTIARLTAQLEEVKKAVISTQFKAPETQKVTVTNPTPIQEFPIKELLDKLEDVERAITNINIEFPAPQEIKFPEMPKTVNIAEGKALLAAIEDLGKKINEIPNSMPEAIFPTAISIDNFPPQKYPLPVTHMSINSLGGTVKTRAITVNSTTPTPLPDEVLAYRRSMVIYNNSSTIILYVGGSDVTSTNGMPVPPSSYSPSFDAGPKMIVYGIAASSTINVRVMEASDENSGR